MTFIWEETVWLIQIHSFWSTLHPKDHTEHQGKGWLKCTIIIWSQPSARDVKYRNLYRFWKYTYQWLIFSHAQYSACINYLTHKANGNNFLFLQSRKHKTAQMQTHIPNNLLILSLSQCCSYGKRSKEIFYFIWISLIWIEMQPFNIMALVCMMHGL